MSTEFNRGYVGFLLLTMIAVVVAVGSFLLYERDLSAPAYVADNPPQEVPKKNQNLASSIVGYGLFTGSGENSLSQAQKNIETKKEVTPPIEKGVAFLDNKKSDKQVSITPIKKSTPQTIVAETISEPTLIVTKGIQPARTLLLADARRVQFTVIEMAAKGGDVVVNGLEIERMGLAKDRVFTEVGVLDVDYERALNANHKYSTKEDFTLKDGESREVVLFGNIRDKDALADYDAQAPSLALSNIKTSAKISGTLPIVGTTHTVNSSLTIGSLTMSSSGFDPRTNRTIYINSNNIIFSAVRASVGSSEPIKLTEFSFTQNGSASPKDLANVQICVVYKGSTNCTPTEMDETNKYFTASFENPPTIGKGEAVEVYIKGDVLGTGAGRTINFDITSSYDVIAYGTNYRNYIYSKGGENDGVQPEGSYSTSEYPFYNGYKHTISAGSFGNIGK